MTELSLLTKPVKLEVDGLPSAERVVGIRSAGSKVIWEYGYRPDGLEYEEILSLDTSGTSDNIFDFYERTRAVNPEMQEFYNCHAMVWFALGAINQLHRYESYDGVTYDAQTSLGNLKAGHAYGINRNGAINHSVLGMNQPNLSLSVLGDYNFMAIVDNSTILNAYGGDSLHLMHPFSARIDVESS